MTFLQLTSALLGGILATLIILLEVYLWQRKEYRWDRMRAFLLGPESKTLQDAVLVIFWLLAVCGWVAYAVGQSQAAELLGWGALITLAGRYLRLYLLAGLFRPDLTLKAGLTLAFSVAASLVFLFVAISNQQLLTLQIATALLLLPLGIALAVGIANIVTGLRKRAIISRATQLRAAQSPTVIAITGSVGKTSVKEFTTHILHATGKTVAATKQHRNSEFTVAQDLLEQLPSKPEIYVVEAAAYRQGEIAAIAKITKPTIGVITAITNQHEALFGSKAALAKAKWELAEAVKELVLNMDDPTIRRRAAQTNARVIAVSTSEAADIYATNISIEPEKITCEVHIANTQARITLPVVGEGALQGALLAAAAAYAAGIEPNVIFKALKDLPTLEQTMQVRDGIKGAQILDDSYSGSKAAALNAIAHLQRFTASQKHIVFVPLIELAGSGTRTHEEIGRALGSSGAQVFVFGRAYQQAIARGAEINASNITWFSNPNRLLETIGKSVNKESVVLLEGRVPDVVRRALLHD